jgi:transcriptional regulator with XRE-family HTH domain
MIDPATCRAARALLGWTQQQLAAASGASTYSIATYETGRSQMKSGNLAAIERALAEAGVEIITEAGRPVGVRDRRPSPEPQPLRDG